MKNLLKSISLGLLSFLFFYLAGAFGNHSFDLSKWGETSLMSVSVFGLLAFFTIVCASFDYFEREDEKNKR